MTRSLFLAVALFAALPAKSQVDVLTQRYDNARSGANLNGWLNNTI